MDPTNTNLNSTDPAPGPVPPITDDQAVKVTSSEIPIIPKSSNRILPLLIVIVLLFLGVGAFIYFTKPKELVKAPENADMKPSVLFLTVTSPKDNVTSVNGEILVAGRTLPNTSVVIYSDVDETIVDSDAEGKFEETVIVGDAGGLLGISVYAEDGNEETKMFVVRENNPISSAPSNVLGISKTAPGQAKKNTDVVSVSTTKKPTGKTNPNNPTGNKKPTSIPTPDLKTKKLISDFLGNKVTEKKLTKVGIVKLKNYLVTEGTGSAVIKGLKLKKLEALTATPGATPKRHALSGVITDATDGTLTIAHQIQRDRVNMVYYNTTTLITGKGITGASDLIVGMRIAAVGEPVTGGLLAKRIHVIPGLARGVFEKNPVSSPSGAVSPSPTATLSGTPTLTVTPTAEVTPTESPTPTETPIETPTPTL